MYFLRTGLILRGSYLMSQGACSPLQIPITSEPRAIFIESQIPKASFLGKESEAKALPLKGHHLKLPH